MLAFLEVRLRRPSSKTDNQRHWQQNARRSRFPDKSLYFFLLLDRPAPASPSDRPTGLSSTASTCMNNHLIGTGLLASFLELPLKKFSKEMLHSYSHQRNFRRLLYVDYYTVNHIKQSSSCWTFCRVQAPSSFAAANDRFTQFPSKQSQKTLKICSFFQLAEVTYLPSLSITTRLRFSSKKIISRPPSPFSISYDIAC